MNSRGARLALLVVGVIALITGAIWIGQGSNVILGSFMTGNSMWLGIGVIVALVGLVLVLLGLRRGAGGRRRS